MPRQFVWLKVVVLAFAFVAVIWAIRSIHRGALNAPLAAVGFPSSNGLTDIPGRLTDLADVDWCPTRIKSIVFSNHVKLVEEGFHWVLYSPNRHELNSVSVERWLAELCKLHPTATKHGITQNPLRNFATIYFINGKSKSFWQDGDVFVAGGMAFRSQKLSRIFGKLGRFH